MLRKIFFGLLWLGFISYAFVLAPPDDPNTLELIKNLSTSNLEGINPLIISIFNLMGILPIMYASLLFIDGKGQKIKAWPFAIGSFGVGAFALLPYLALRQPNPEFTGEKDILLKIFDSRITAIFIAIGAIILFYFGLSKGDWGDFIQQWYTSKFIHVMSLDFCLLSLLFPTLIDDDLTRRGISNKTLFLVMSFIPFFGALIYLIARPPIESQQEEIQPTVGIRNSEFGIRK